MRPPARVPTSDWSRSVDETWTIFDLGDYGDEVSVGGDSHSLLVIHVGPEKVIETVRSNLWRSPTNH